jgi:hypothetical protein
MRELQPYKTLRGAQRALDNGGRFYNMFARSGDEVIDQAELAKAAGVYSAGAKAFLHFEMGLMDLPPEQREEIVTGLSPDLLEKYRARKPAISRPSMVESQGSAGAMTIVSGYPAFVEDKTQFRGFIVLVVPVIVLVPIFDQFDVYEVYDTPDLSTPRTVIATTRGTKRLDGVHTRFGGPLKELYFEDKTSKGHGLFLEAIYYTRLE